MRARLAIKLSGVRVQLREILLRDKPEEMLIISSKGTVPVLQLNNGKVIDESLDVMLWAFKQNDPEGILLQTSTDEALSLVKANDESFKPNLDLYKYSVRFPEKTQDEYRDNSLDYLEKLDERLARNSYLFGPTIGLADLAIFPFIRQFAGVDSKWFDASPFENLITWKNTLQNSALFKSVMLKYAPWKDVQTSIYF